MDISINNKSGMESYMILKDTMKPKEILNRTLQRQRRIWRNYMY
jgi:hypothetical protein